MNDKEAVLINTYDQLKAAARSGFNRQTLVAIGYHSPDRSNSRDVSVMKWSLFSPFFKTDPEAAWYDNNCKVFSLFHGGDTHKQRKDSALKLAMGWATEQYGVKEWAKNRTGDYVPKEVNDRFPIPKRAR